MPGATTKAPSLADGPTLIVEVENPEETAAAINAAIAVLPSGEPAHCAAA